MIPLTTLKVLLDDVTKRHGYVEPIELMAAILAWQSRYFGTQNAKRMIEAAGHLMQAAEMIRPMEAEDFHRQGLLFKNPD